MPRPKEPQSMLTWEEDVEAAALRAQGWSISAIARHLDRDRKTIRAYPDGDRVPGQRRRSGPDVFAPFADYVAAQISAGYPTLPQALHTSVARVSHCADRLEAELRMYSPLKPILNSAIRYVEARTGRHVDEQWLARALRTHLRRHRSAATYALVRPAVPGCNTLETV